jgi:hypothetical protein
MRRLLSRHALLLIVSSFRGPLNITTCLIMPRRHATWSRAGQLVGEGTAGMVGSPTGARTAVNDK